MNVLQRIADDHKRQRSLMEKIAAAANDSEERHKLFTEFSAEFKAHAAAEEHAFYAPLLKHPKSTDQSRHSVAEHHEAIELLTSLEEEAVSNDNWMETFKKLMHDNNHHMDEEEDDVFPLAKEMLGDDRLNELTVEFDKRKSIEESE